ncbi:MAG: xylan 1,4-beta-xylosidase [Clostridia bacterium]|nr:xylan 1,4-beta-xylosidase [Clostridia bacterium]
MAAKQKRFIKVYSESMGENQIFVDSVTGVNYFYHNGGYGGGLTVLLDADGKPVVTPIKE